VDVEGGDRRLAVLNRFFHTHATFDIADWVACITKYFPVCPSPVLHSKLGDLYGHDFDAAGWMMMDDQ